MYTFKIGKAKLAYNFSDARTLEKFENAFREFGVVQDGLPKDVPGSAQIRYICSAVFDLFNTIFGDGTAKKVFGDSCDLEVCIDAAGQLIEARNAADKEISERIRSMNAKYLPKK